MREAGVATYLPDMEIRRPDQNRIKMRLILGTHNPKGVEVFRDIQNTVKKEEIKIRHAIEIKNSEQGSLFSIDQLIECEDRNYGVGCPALLRPGRRTRARQNIT